MEVYIGMIFLFAGNFAPRGFQFCQGQLLPIQTNTALFSLLGTTYGGDGVRTFALPDLRGRAAVSAGQGPGLTNYVLGELTGKENVQLLVGNMPAHTHTLNGDNSASGKEVPGPNHVIGQSLTDKMYSVNAPNTSMNPASIGTAGGNLPFSVVQPVLALNYVIAVQGIFPSRN